MPRVSRKDLLKMMEFLHDLYAMRSEETFIQHIPAALLPLIRSDVNSHTYNNKQNGTVVTTYAPLSFPALPNVNETLEYCYRIEGKPMEKLWRDKGTTTPVRFSEGYSSKADFHRTTLFNEFHWPHRTPYGLVALLGFSSHDSSLVCLHRGGRDFITRDVAILTLADSHLKQAFANAQRVSTMEHGLQTYADTVHTLPQAIVAVGPKGKIAWATPKGKTLVRKYAGSRTEAGDLLASPFREWLRQQDALLDDPDLAPTEQVPLVLEGSGYRLTVRVIRQNEFRLLFFEEEPEALPIERLQAHGLTRRECEVMQWVIAGKSNPDISRILGVSVVTVEKHLGSVFLKLNVENRTAAVTTAFDLMKRRNGFE